MLPKHKIRLVVFEYKEFKHNGAKKLLRLEEHDRDVIQQKLSAYLPSQGP